MDKPQLPVEADARVQAWDDLIKKVSDLSTQIDEAVPGWSCSLAELGQQMQHVLAGMDKLEDRMVAVAADVKSQEADWLHFRDELCHKLQLSAELMRSLEEYRLTDLSGGFTRFVDELVKTMRAHDCRFRTYPAAQRALFRQNRKTIVRSVLCGAWKTVSDLNNGLATVATVAARQDAVTADAVQRVERLVVDYARGLEDRGKTLASRIKDMEERTRAIEDQLQNLERYNKNLREMVTAGDSHGESGEFSKASPEELETELKELKAKSSKLRAILDNKCECSRVQQ